MLYAPKSIPIKEWDDAGIEAAKRTILQEAQVLVAARHGHVVKVIEKYFPNDEHYTLSIFPTRLISVVVPTARWPTYLGVGSSPQVLTINRAMKAANMQLQRFNLEDSLVIYVREADGRWIP
ncbi:hypothetical protein VE01_07774 [Pseudogymnoascus verrucosus]|uniref:Protein kinase domain-containing protein n=1 Tax=Pseudogymnoascus verrucosus TaxID=342668 RepID=A0A1B8GEY7_9PEZI|nr:uncharacterized protein VE01_07774 [Pseudogymnoascus verrucosus]OBT94395.1 hypothetical protein VE01_07774 [Pseudogymnoascus verrucosus]